MPDPEDDGGLSSRVGDALDAGDVAGAIAAAERARTAFHRSLALTELARLLAKRRRRAEAASVLQRALHHAERVRDVYDRSWPLALAAAAIGACAPDAPARAALAERVLARVAALGDANEELPNDLDEIAWALARLRVPRAEKRRLFVRALDGAPDGHAGGFWLAALADALESAGLGAKDERMFRDAIAARAAQLPEGAVELDDP